MSIDTSAERKKLEELAGFTPGPWYVPDQSYRDILNVAVDDGILCPKTGGGAHYTCDVCELYGNDTREWFANARAIAATPDTIASAHLYLDKIDARDRKIAALRAERDNLTRRLDALANENGKRNAALRALLPLVEAVVLEGMTDCADWDAALEATRALL